MLCALIMAGGKGTRFWPLSTEKKPKQFLNLLGEETMIQMTVNRLLPLISMDRIFVVTGKQYKDLVMEQLPKLPEENIIIEPYGRNTAPCIALSAFYIDKKFKNATLAVLPSDHLIKDEGEFLKTLAEAGKFVDYREESIVTIGIKPDRPDTGYGYINFGRLDTNDDEYEVREVNRFVEKPDEDKAIKYLENGNYLWNAGMFIWKTKNILALTNKYLKKTYDVLNEISAACDEDYETELNTKYEYVDNISIDYGILEKCNQIYVIPSEFGWDDVGSWKALQRYCKKDKNGNISIGENINFSCNNSIIISNNKPIVIAGLDKIFVVESEDVIIVGNKDKIDEIKEIKDRL